MKRFLPVVMLLVALMTVATRAQDDADYTNWMKQVNDANGSLRKELKAKAGDDAADDASKLAGQVGQFWQKRNADDAAKFAVDAESGFKQVAGFASTGKFDEASAVLKSTQADCSGCHKAHRAVTLHGWKMK
jgi:cytochrome c556